MVKGMAIEESVRKIFNTGKYSKAVTLPIDWVKFLSWWREEELKEVHCARNKILVMGPKEMKDKLLRYLKVSERFPPEVVDKLLQVPLNEIIRFLETYQRSIEPNRGPSSGGRR